MLTEIGSCRGTGGIGWVALGGIKKQNGFSKVCHTAFVFMEGSEVVMVCGCKFPLRSGTDPV